LSYPVIILSFLNCRRPSLTVKNDDKLAIRDPVARTDRGSSANTGARRDNRLDVDGEESKSTIRRKPIPAAGSGSLSPSSMYSNLSYDTLHTSVIRADSTHIHTLLVDYLRLRSVSSKSQGAEVASLKTREPREHGKLHSYGRYRLYVYLSSGCVLIKFPCVGCVGSLGQGLFSVRAENDVIDCILSQFMDENGSMNMELNSLPADEMMIPLVEREDCIRKLRTVFQLWTESYEAKSKGRTGYIIPVLVGISGVGKTRLLNEYKQYLPSMPLLVAVQVQYFNGHSMNGADLELPIVQTFSLRLLHWFFKEGIENQLQFSSFWDIVQQTTTPQLPVNIVRACRTIRKALELTGYLDSSQVLRIFIGIDEYQSICSKKLLELKQALLGAAHELCCNYKIWIFPAFAGTEWGRVQGFDSTDPYVRRVSVPWLSLDSTLLLSHCIYDGALASEIFVNCVTIFGGVARTSIAFAKSVCAAGRHNKNSVAEVADMISARTDIMTTYLDRFYTTVNVSGFVQLVAHGVCDEPVSPAAPSCIPGMNWQALENRGFIALQYQPTCLLCAVRIPHCLVVYCTTLRFESGTVEARFVDNLASIVSMVGNGAFQWKNWEDFGAHYHSLRMNALMLLGNVEVPLSRLMLKAGGLDIIVKLRQARVCRAAVPLCHDTDLAAVGEEGNSSSTRSSVDPHTCYVFLNGTNGEGVDIYFMLVTQSGDYVLIMDQRKVRNETVRTATMNSQAQKIANVAPSSINGISIKYRLSFYYSAVADVSPSIELPVQHYVLGRDELVKYHGPLATCYFAVIRINPNTANQSALRSILGLDKDQSLEFMKVRTYGKIFLLSHLNAALERVGAPPLDNNMRRFVLVVDIPNGAGWLKSTDGTNSRQTDHC
jgi:hypothetical protein